MIFISSSCVKGDTIAEVVRQLAQEGFQNIELSGGTDYYPELEEDLLALKSEYGLNYLCHNYFPPPRDHFVLNLASLDDEMYGQTLEHLKGSIDLSRRLGSPQFGFHAGFYMDIPVDQIGGSLSKRELSTREAAEARFCQGFGELKSYAGEITLFVENNVCSQENYQRYNQQQPFMLCTSSDVASLSSVIDFNLLLDVAHLKVSSHSLSQDFYQELQILVRESDYLHISDNDGLSDLNHPLEVGSYLYKTLKKHNLQKKTCTLEVYGTMQEIHESWKRLQELVDE